MKVLCSLNGAWKGRYFSPAGEEVVFSGAVPGCAHTDLWNAGIIPDPYFEYQSKECQFIETMTFEYEKTFLFEGKTDGVRLRFEKLDTYGDIFLNGSLVGSCNNMFLLWEFDIADVLREGENHLVVRFYPPAEQVNDRPEKPAAFTAERIWIRRMQCTFGWDWVERFVTMGIEGDVFLYRMQETEVESVYIATTAVDAYGAEVMFDLRFAQIGENETMVWRVEAPNGDVIWSQKRAIVEPEVLQHLSVRKAQLWWPNGYGEQPLYKLYLSVFDRDGNLLNERSERFGIRTIRILEVADEKGSDNWKISEELKKIPHIGENDYNEEYTGYQVLVNGEPVFCRGGNWVPSEPFPTAVRREKMEEILRLTAQANMNMVRVWGGGLIESDDFYDICDELGLLVCQDFLMACGQYPEEEEWFLEELRKEGREAVKRIRNHPSLAWWIGDNENSALGSVEEREYSGRTAANLINGPIVNELDKYRRFMPSSPCGGKSFGSATCGTCHGTMHLVNLFEKIKDGDLSDYHELLLAELSRFNNEIPVFGAPALSSMRRFMAEEHLYDDDCLEFHTKNNPSGIIEIFPIYRMHRTFAENLYGTFKDGEDKLLKMRALQYEWVRYMMEMYRRNREYTGGILFWMLNDCWPSNSWALVDYYMNPKAGWYAANHACRPVIGSVEKQGDTFYCKIANEAKDVRRGTVRISIWNVSEIVPVAEECVSYEVQAGTAITLCPIPWELPMTGHVYVLDVFDEQGERVYRSTYFPKRIRDLALPSLTDCDVVEVKERGEDYIVVCANRYVQTVNLDGDHIFEDNFFTMLPGEERRISFTPIKEAERTEVQVYVI